MNDLFISDFNLIRWGIATTVTVLLLGGLALLTAKLKQDKADGLPKRLRLLERLALTPRHQLHLVQHNGQDYLILTGPQGDTVLPPAATLKEDA